MDAKEVIQRVRSSLSSATSSGATSISVNAVAAVVDAAERQVLADIEGEFRAHELRVSALRYEHELQRSLEMIKLTTSSGFTALRTAVLINGGAVIALLAFMGSQRGASMPELARSMVGPLGWFTTGAMVSAFATGLGYLAQAGFGNEFKWKSVEIGVLARILAIALVLFAYGAFVTGAFRAASVFANNSAATRHIETCPLVRTPIAPRALPTDTNPRR